MRRGGRKPDQDLEHPPELAERFLQWCLPGQYQDSIIGDLAEEFQHRVGNGRGASIWYWRQILESSPALLLFSVQKLRRSLAMQKVSPRTQQSVILAGLGLVLLLPALLLCIGGSLQSLLGASLLYEVIEAVHLDQVLFNPLVLLVGLALGFAANLIPVLKVQFQDGSVIGSAKLRGRTLNLAVLAFVVLLMGTIFTYLLAENFQILAIFT